MHFEDEVNVETPSDEDQSADISDAGLHSSSTPENTVDELESQVAKLQVAMDQLQSGDLDRAEASIEALEHARAVSATAGEFADGLEEE